MARTLAAALALLLAGCSLAPTYQRPAPPVAGGWDAGAAPAAVPANSATAAADLGWREVFLDPRLQALIGMALESNRDLRVAALNVELTRAQYQIERAPRLPSLGGSASATRQHASKNLSTSGRPVTVDTYTVGLGITGFELDLFGRVRSLSDAALEQYLASEEARRAVHLSLVAAVATQFLSLSALDAQVDLARRTLETVESSGDLARRTFEAGRTSELDMRTGEAQVATARGNLSAAVMTRNRAGHALAVLLGRPVPADLPPAGPLDAQAFVAELPPGLPSEVLLRRPDILAAEHALRSANAVIGAARAAFLPSITLTAFAGTSSAELSGLFGSGSGLWSFAPQITLPIFRGGALSASLDAAQVRKAIQVAQYERAIQGAFREVADALVSRAALEEQLEAQRARVAAEEKRYQLSELRYRKGVDSYLGVLTAQRDLFAAQQALIQARFARFANLVDLYRALGGGWLERTAGAPAAPAGGKSQGPAGHWVPS